MIFNKIFASSSCVLIQFVKQKLHVIAFPQDWSFFHDTEGFKHLYLDTQMEMSLQLDYIQIKFSFFRENQP